VLVVVSPPVNGRHTHKQALHSDWVESVAFSPDGACIISGSYDNTIRRWDAASGTAIGEPLQGHTKDTLATSHRSHSPPVVLTSSLDLMTKLFDATLGTVIGEPLQGHTRTVTSVAFSPDGASVIAGSYGQTIRLWGVVSGTTIGKSLRDTMSTSVAFTPDGTYITSGSDDKTIDYGM